MNISRLELEEMGISSETITILRNVRKYRPARFWDSAQSEARLERCATHMANALELDISTEKLKQQRRHILGLMTIDIS